MSGTDDASPQEVRDRLARSYEASYRRLGVDVAPDAMRELAIHDLEVVDAGRRLGEIDAPDVRPDDGPREKPQEIVEAEAETGMRLFEKGEGAPVKFAESDATMMFSGERWALAGGRVSRILEGAGGSSDVREAVKNAAYPKLALEYVDVWFAFMSRNRFPIADRKNPFDGLSDADACRMLVRRVEDVCDKSSVHMGPWRVPK